jgi:hypothetical protein
VFVDRLSDVKDHHFFAGVFLAGIIVMLVFRLWLNLDAIIVSVTLAFLLFGYFLAITVTRKYQLREDKSADNLYFLGFLFTVTALIISLWKFSQSEDGASNNPLVVVEDLGIGLITTLVGLFLRVFLTQLRRDPNEIEEEVNLQLTVTAQKVTRNIRSVSELVEQSSILMAQIYSESQKQLADQQQLTKEMFENAEKSIKNANSKVVLSIDELSSRLNDVQIEPDLITSKIDPALITVGQSLESFSAKLNEMEIPHDLFSEKAANALPASLFAERVEAVLPPSLFSERIQEALDPVPSILEAKFEDLRDTTKTKIEESLGKITNEINVLIGNLEVSPDLLTDQLRGVFDSLDQFKPLLEEGLRGTQFLIERHNSALKDNVENLTGLTSSLVQTADGLIEASSAAESTQVGARLFSAEITSLNGVINRSAEAVGNTRTQLENLAENIERTRLTPEQNSEMQSLIEAPIEAFGQLRFQIESLNNRLNEAAGMIEGVAGELDAAVHQSQKSLPPSQTPEGN